MFNLSTQEVVLSIEKSPLLEKHGAVYQEYNNFFGNTLLNKIKNEIKNLKVVKLENQENRFRERVDYNEKLCKELKIIFLNQKITEALENKFNTTFKFSSIDIWYDYPGYYLEPHKDDYRIKLALQIYLGEDNIGTSLFENNNIFHTFKYKCNNGYALLNNNNGWHGTEAEVNKEVRKSIYIRYS
jgi:hypothetical protein